MGPARQNDVAGLRNVTLTSNLFFSFIFRLGGEMQKVMSNGDLEPLVFVKIHSGLLYHLVTVVFVFLVYFSLYGFRHRERVVESVFIGLIGSPSPPKLCFLS